MNCTMKSTMKRTIHNALTNAPDDLFKSKKKHYHFSGLFERRVLEYREEMAELTSRFTSNVKQLGRKMMNFVSESKGRIKKALASGNNVYV